MLSLFLVLFVATQSSVPPAPQDDIKVVLARAETLYYEARFNESIKLLAGINDVLQARPDRTQDRIAAKLQLALSHIGLNDTPTAKTLLNEIYILDPDYVLDPQQFSPKVIALANDAKNEQKQIRCRKAGEDSRNYLARLDSAALVSLLDSMKPKCPELAQIGPEAADIFYKQGVADYKQTNYLSALQAFRSTIKLAPAHELAQQYLELTQSNLQVAADRLLLQWQKNFDAGLYKEAAADYRAMRTYGEAGNPAALNHVTAEYRKALTPLMANWTTVCAAGDTAESTRIQNQISELMPDSTVAADLRSQMGPCVPRQLEAPRIASAQPRPDSAVLNAASRATDTRSPQPRPAVKPGCFQMESAAALTRLKTRVSPLIPREALAFLQNSQVTIRVKVRIDESGSVTAFDAQGSNPVLNNAVRTSVEQWKFSAAMDENGPRCVDTEIPVAVGR